MSYYMNCVLVDANFVTFGFLEEVIVKLNCYHPGQFKIKNGYFFKLKSLLDP